ncbi:imidazole glycerol phosphate synthase subunit HisH [Terrimonas ferruginea]|uniref:imidazole glycerol phosphate synthase subunit HisH n=1 Tax=Terrimonas ferruginea TaxID=249 RepID=UPI0003FB3A1B|nr:imidazole glycerol phosphate synthase subunit HisH [Terrimonas ferruginea]
MNIVIIKYNAGNTQSVLFALERIGAQATVTDDESLIRSADRVIFPGVGEAATAMQYLREKGLDKVIPTLTQPVLGICLGMQLLCAHSEERDTPCLNIIPVTVQKFSTANELKVPQIGWNTIHHLRSPLFNDVPDNSYIYNVHGYYAPESAYAIALCDYGIRYAAALNKDNFYGIQFHAEKSAATGEQILKNFLSL